MENTIRQHFTWRSLSKDINDVCKKCHTCQLTKQTTAKYGHLPVKENNSKLLETLCVDWMGRYKIPRKGKITRSKKDFF
jgi:hypothetical protein